MLDHRQQQRLEELFHRAADLSGSERQAFLAAHCGSDRELTEELATLLAQADEGTKDYLDPLQLVAGTAAGEPPAQPERIGPYQVLGRIGAGGMGIVYEAMQERPQRKVALKVMRPGAVDPGHWRRLEHEADALGRLRHPGIAHVYEAGTFDFGHGQQPFIAMERIEGRPLHEWIAERKLPVTARLELLAKVCDAVHHAHQQGVIHRDLKPDNVLVTEEGQPKVLDFGIASLDGSAHADRGHVAGTLAYMSPERLLGERELSTAADVYALGVIAYRVLSGVMPFDVAGGSLTEAVAAIAGREARRLGMRDPALRGDVEIIVAKAMASDPRARYESAAALAADLRRHLADHPILAREPSASYQLRKFARRHRGLVGGVLAATVAIGGGTAATIWFAIDARTQRNEAASQRDLAHAQAYRLALRSALDGLELGRHDMARTLLADAPRAQRGWEWHHVSSRLEPWRAEITADPPLRGPICYTPDGARIVAVLTDGTIAAWDVATGVMSRPFPAPAKVQTIARRFSSDPPRLAAGAADGRIFVWKDAGAPEVLAGHGRPVLQLAWADNGDLFSVDRQAWRRWRGGTCLGSGPLDSARAPVSAIAVAPDASALVALSNQRVIRCDTATGVQQGIRDLSHSDDVLFTPDGRRLLLSTRHQNLRVRDARTLERLDTDSGHLRNIRMLDRSPDGSLLASTSPDGTLTLRDASTLATIDTHPRGRPLAGVAFRPDGQQLACSDEDGRHITLWDLPAGPNLVLAHGGSNVDELAWSGDGCLLATGTQQHVLRVFDALTGEELAKYPGHPAAFGEDSLHVLVHRASAHPRAPPESRFTVLDLATGEVTPCTARGGAAKREFLARFGGRLASGLSLLDVDPASGCTATWVDGEELAIVAADGSTLAKSQLRRPRAVRFSRDGRLLAIGAANGALELLDARTWKRTALVPSLTRATVLAVDFSPDQHRIALACHDNTVRLIDAETHELVVELQGHASHVAGVQFSPDGSRLATASGDNTVRIWDSVPRHARTAEARAAAAQRARLAPRVEALLAQLGDVRAVAAHLRGSHGLDESDRKAALAVLMRRTMRER